MVFSCQFGEKGMVAGVRVCVLAYHAYEYANMRTIVYENQCV